MASAETRSMKSRREITPCTYLSKRLKTSGGASVVLGQPCQLFSAVLQTATSSCRSSSKASAFGCNLAQLATLLLLVLHADTTDNVQPLAANRSPAHPAPNKWLETVTILRSFGIHARLLFQVRQLNAQIHRKAADRSHFIGTTNIDDQQLLGLREQLIELRTRKRDRLRRVLSFLMLAGSSARLRKRERCATRLRAAIEMDRVRNVSA